MQLFRLSSILFALFLISVPVVYGETIVSVTATITQPIMHGGSVVYVNGYVECSATVDPADYGKLLKCSAQIRKYDGFCSGNATQYGEPTYSQVTMTKI